MPSVVIDIDRAREKDLPQCCMRCGAPSTVCKERNFSWTPPWTIVLILGGLLPYIIVAMILTKRARVAIPLCDNHANHWLWRGLVIWLSLLALVGLFFGSMVLIANLGRKGDDLGGFVCIGCLVLGVGWIITAMILQGTAIRPNRIDDYEISLAGVAPEFVDALDDLREERKRKRLAARSAAGAPAPAPAIPGVADTKPCPYCGQKIKAQATRCKFCREELDEDEAY
jgi:hypothetical protein